MGLLDFGYSSKPINTHHALHTDRIPTELGMNEGQTTTAFTSAPKIKTKCSPPSSSPRKKLDRLTKLQWGALQEYWTMLWLTFQILMMMKPRTFLDFKQPHRGKMGVSASTQLRPSISSYISKQVLTKRASGPSHDNSIWVPMWWCNPLKLLSLIPQFPCLTCKPSLCIWKLVNKQA